MLLKRLRELDEEIAENERELWQLKKRQAAQLPNPETVVRLALFA